MFIARPDASLFCLDFGAGPRTLLGLGGWIGSGELWLDVVGRLPHWRSVVYDHRGCGASAHAGPSIPLQTQVDDLFAVMDARGVSRCVLAAESAGAGVALEAALQAPERFDGMVLVGASWTRPAPGELDGFIAALRADHTATLRAFVAGCLPEPGTADLKRWGLQVLQRASLDDAIALLRARDELRLEDRVAALRVPVLLVHGEADAIVPVEKSAQLAARLPDAVLHRLPGLGHVPLVTAPERVAALIDGRFGLGAGSTAR